MKLKVYLDESGNTGENYTDPTQPFYMCCGYVFREESVPLVEKEILHWESQIKKSGQKEIKSSQLLKTKKGPVQLIDLAQRIGKLGGMPSYTIFEKKFGICAKITEAFIDHEFNSSLPKEYWEDREFRYNIANELYENLSEDFLIKFADTSRRRNQSEIKTLIDELMKEMESVPSVKQLFLGCKMSEAENYLLSGDGISNAINNTVFFCELANIERFARGLGIQKWDLYHDETFSFQGSYSDLVNRLKNRFSDYCSANFNQNLPAGEYLIDEFELVESVKSPLIRGADYFSGLVRYLLENRNSNLIERDKAFETAYIIILGPMIRLLHPQLDFPPLTHEVLSARVGVEVIKNFRTKSNTQ